jgi:glycosidase
VEKIFCAGTIPTGTYNQEDIVAKWFEDAFFYHIYPLGFCGAPQDNDFSSAPVDRLDKVSAWMDHIQSLGANALYLGPLFESSRHGYDTADYYHVDRRLGGDPALERLSADLRRRGVRLVLDGVFNHVGRDFWAFRDVIQRGEQSPYRDWFQNLNFNGRSPYNDPFTYEGWAGHASLVKLNLNHPDVKGHLFQAVASWVERFDIAGLRLDAADVIDFNFLSELVHFCRGLKPDFYLFGEVVHGDYRRWANPDRLDATTNYEVYKSLYSSHVDGNYFEIAYALNRQFGPQGMYSGLPLYNFADNHDVNRVASNLKNSGELYPLYCLMFTMPGVPSIYYGSEWGITGTRTRESDRDLRPCLDLSAAAAGPNRDLAGVIARLAGIRRDCPALRCGNYTSLLVAARQYAFARQAQGEAIVTAVNSAPAEAQIELSLPVGQGRLVDLLNPGESFPIVDGKSRLTLHACWGRILRIESGY